MKVYVLSGYADYEGGPVLGVYACRYQAERELKRLEKLSIEYHDFKYGNGLEMPEELKSGDVGFDGYDIDEFELIEVKE